MTIIGNIIIMIGSLVGIAICIRLMGKLVKVLVLCFVLVMGIWVFDSFAYDENKRLRDYCSMTFPQTSIEYEDVTVPQLRERCYLNQIKSMNWVEQRLESNMAEVVMCAIEYELPRFGTYNYQMIEYCVRGN